VLAKRGDSGEGMLGISTSQPSSVTTVQRSTEPERIEYDVKAPVLHCSDGRRATKKIITYSWLRRGRGFEKMHGWYDRANTSSWAPPTRQSYTANVIPIHVPPFAFAKTPSTTQLISSREPQWRQQIQSQTNLASSARTCPPTPTRSSPT
jgi:hypothetical protein